MSDVCDGSFFVDHVWKVLSKDVEIQLAEAGATRLLDATKGAIQREFVKRQYRLATLLAHASATNGKRTPSREAQLAAMQASALMYDAASAIVREQIDAAGLSTAPNDEK